MKNLLNLFTGLLFMGAGCLVYLYSRETGPELLSFISPGKKIFLPEIIRYSSPSFFHCCGIILISIPFYEEKKSSIYLIASFWFMIELFFEAGQKFHIIFEKYLSHDLFTGLNSYFLNGVFDPNDISAAAAGAVTAIIIYKFTPEKPMELQGSER